MPTGSATESYQVATATQVGRPRAGIFDYVLAWTADSSGSVSYTGALPVVGLLLDFWTKPDSGTAPTDNYDITLKDPAGTDILGGLAANRDTANTEYGASVPTKAATDGVNTGTVLRALNGEKLVLDVSNAGNGGKGQLFVRLKV
jgi:hypothetical protein